MSVAIIVMMLLALFHWFYQSTIVVTNNHIFKDDLKLIQHEIDIYEIKNRSSINREGKIIVDEIRDTIEGCKHALERINLVEFISVTISKKESLKKFEEERRNQLESENIDKQIRVYEQKSVAVLLRAMVSNSSLFILLVSPLLAIMWFFEAVKGKAPTMIGTTTSVNIASYTAKHC